MRSAPAVGAAPTSRRPRLSTVGSSASARCQHVACQAAPLVRNAVNVDVDERALIPHAAEVGYLEWGMAVERKQEHLPGIGEQLEALLLHGDDAACLWHGSESRAMFSQHACLTAAHGAWRFPNAVLQGGVLASTKFLRVSSVRLT